MNPQLIYQLDPTLHEKSRLSIASMLKERNVLSFIELKHLLCMTDGNLSVHIKTLEKKGYLDTCKSRETGKMRTTCRLSACGMKALETYLENLELILKAVRNSGEKAKNTGKVKKKELEMN